MGIIVPTISSIIVATMGDDPDGLMKTRSQKLEGVGSSMATIYKDMEEHTKNRRELHENRLGSIEQSITRLEKHFQGSIKTVRDGLKEASELFDGRLRDIDKRLKLSSEKRAHEVENSVSAIRKNLIDIEKRMEEQKALMLRELKETRETIEHQIHEFQVAFDQEKQESLKREEQAQKRLQSSLSKMQERIDIHRESRCAPVCLLLQLALNVWLQAVLWSHASSSSRRISQMQTKGTSRRTCALRSRCGTFACAFTSILVLSLLFTSSHLLLCCISIFGCLQFSGCRSISKSNWFKKPSSWRLRSVVAQRRGVHPC